MVLKLLFSKPRPKKKKKQKKKSQFQPFYPEGEQLRKHKEKMRTAKTLLLEHFARDYKERTGDKRPVKHIVADFEYHALMQKMNQKKQANQNKTSKKSTVSKKSKTSKKSKVSPKSKTSKKSKVSPKSKTSKKRKVSPKSKKSIKSRKK